MVKSILINGAPMKITQGIGDGPDPYSVGFHAALKPWTFESDEAALRELEGAGWFDLSENSGPLPDWRPQGDEGIRTHVNAPGIDYNEPFVTLEGSFTRRQLLALIHFHPDNKEDNNAVRTTEEQRKP